MSAITLQNTAANMALKIERLEATAAEIKKFAVKNLENVRRLEGENAELKDVIADLTAELEKRTAGYGELKY